MNKNLKQDIIKKAAVVEGDTGSADVQVALLTGRISQVTEHLKKFPKDFHSRNGLLKLIGRRRRLMTYLGRTQPARRDKLVADLGLRHK